MHPSFHVVRRAAVGALSAALARDREGNQFYLLEPGRAQAEEILGRCAYLPEVQSQIVYGDGAPALVMKVPEGIPLDQIEGTALTEQEIVHALTGLAHALVALEQADCSLPAGVVARGTLVRDAQGHYRFDLPAACLNAVPVPGGWPPPSPPADLERLCLELLAARRPLGKNHRLHALDIFSRRGSSRTLAEWATFLHRLQQNHPTVAGRSAGTVKTALVAALLVAASVLLLQSAPWRGSLRSNPPTGTQPAPPTGTQPAPSDAIQPAPAPLPACAPADQSATTRSRDLYLNGRAVCTAHLQLDPQPALSLDALRALLGVNIRIDGYDDYALDLAIDGRPVMIPASAARRVAGRWWLVLHADALGPFHLELKGLNSTTVQLVQH